jgi:hypothetical protein
MAAGHPVPAMSPRATGRDRGCVKTMDDSFVDAKDPDLAERGSILDEILEHKSSESNSANLVFSFYTASANTRRSQG